MVRLEQHYGAGPPIRGVCEGSNVHWGRSDDDNYKGKIVMITHLDHRHLTLRHVHALVLTAGSRPFLVHIGTRGHTQLCAYEVQMYPVVELGLGITVLLFPERR